MKLWGAAVLSAVLLELPLPIAGPMPPWRSIFAWFGLVPLLWALLSPNTTAGQTIIHLRVLDRESPLPHNQFACSLISKEWERRIVQ